ncbi:MAG: zinc-ribbon domain-containing protein [Pseudomonadota bacterium]
MVQITCPKCDASYNVPDSALGTKGRKVSCAKCGFEWRAMPPQAEEAAPSEAAPEPVEPQVAEPPVASEEAPAVSEGPAAPEAPAAPPPQAMANEEQLREDRARQLAEIRQIVDEVQQDPPSGEPPAPATGASPDAAAGVPFPPAQGEEKAPEGRSFIKSLANRVNQAAESESLTTPPPPPPMPTPKAQAETDDLRERIAQRSVDQKVGTAKVTEKSRRKMLKKHNRRAAKKTASDKRSSGAFATGFLLVLILVSVLSSLYLLAPQISAQVPEAEPVLNNYIAKVDEARASAYGIVEVFMERIEPVLPKEEDSQG